MTPTYATSDAALAALRACDQGVVVAAVRYSVPIRGQMITRYVLRYGGAIRPGDVVLARRGAGAASTIYTRRAADLRARMRGGSR